MNAFKDLQIAAQETALAADFAVTLPEKPQTSDILRRLDSITPQRFPTVVCNECYAMDTVQSALACPHKTEERYAMLITLDENGEEVK
jgi:hypothetical protein